MKTTNLLTITAIVLGLSIGWAPAAVINTVTAYKGGFVGNGTTVIVEPNLVSSASTVLSSPNFVAFQTASIANLKDVSFGTVSTSNGSGTALDLNAWTLNIALDLTGAATGYDINNIKLLSTWTGDWVSQNFTLSYATVSAPTSFISLGSFTANTTPVDNTNQNPYTLQSSLTDSVGAIATNVGYLQFAFASGGNKGAYNEIEAFGVASVPEPSTYMLLGMGTALLMVAVLRRRTV